MGATEPLLQYDWHTYDNVEIGGDRDDVSKCKTIFGATNSSQKKGGRSGSLLETQEFILDF